MGKNKMIKLTDLLNEREDFKTFTTKQTSVDPDTGTIEWDVIYDLTPQKLSEMLDNLIENIKEEAQSNKFDFVVKELQRLKTEVKRIR
jgi:hypothetical protein